MGYREYGTMFDLSLQKAQGLATVAIGLYSVVTLTGIIMLLSSDNLRMMILGASLFIVGVLAVGLAKIWYWMVGTRDLMLKELEAMHAPPDDEG